MRSLGAELREHGDDFQAAYEYAAACAEAEGLHFVPSFHPALVRGVATYALELFRGVADLDTVYAPIGMGSGVCGCIATRDALGLKTEIVAVAAASAPAFVQSQAAGRPVEVAVTPTIADGMACRLPNADALEIISAGASRIVTVADEEILSAMRHLFSDTHNVAEGAGAAALAALLQEADRMRGRKVAIILSGGNVDRDVFGKVLLQA
jgi:threonine dehydratase